MDPNSQGNGNPEGKSSRAQQNPAISRTQTTESRAEEMRTPSQVWERAIPDRQPQSSTLSRVDSPGFEIVEQLSPVSSSVAEARNNAIHVLKACRTSLLYLELTRMRKARLGLRNWIAFWHRVYSPDLANTLSKQICFSFPKIDKIFRTISRRLQALTQKILKRIESATTESQLVYYWEYMEWRILAWRRLRQLRVLKALEELRLNLEKIPIDVPDGLFEDLKRGIFALTSWGEYHPGDREAEEHDEKCLGQIDAEGYLRSDPEMVDRPGFTNEFQGALERAAVEVPEVLAQQQEQSTSDEWTTTSDDWSSHISDVISDS